MTEINAALKSAFDYLSQEEIVIPDDIWAKSLRVRVFKADADDLGAISATYSKAITDALTAYLNGGSVTGPRNAFKRATVEAFGGAFDGGWVDGGADLPADDPALKWFNARVDAEFGFIDLLFEQAKELRSEGDDFTDWIAERARSYTNTLREIWNNARLRAMPNMMVTFDGDDGAESCATCKKLKGKRHKISWFISHDYVPPFGSGLECSKGGLCQHGLMDGKGNWITV